MSLRGPLCALGVSGIPYGEVRDNQLAPDPILAWPLHSFFDFVLHGVVVAFRYHPSHLDPRLVVSTDALVLQSTHRLWNDAWMPFEPTPMRARTSNLPT